MYIYIYNWWQCEQFRVAHFFLSAPSAAFAGADAVAAAGGCAADAEGVGAACFCCLVEMIVSFGSLTKPGFLTSRGKPSSLARALPNDFCVCAFVLAFCPLTGNANWCLYPCQHPILILLLMAWPRFFIITFRTSNRCSTLRRRDENIGSGIPLTVCLGCTPNWATSRDASHLPMPWIIIKAWSIRLLGGSATLLMRNELDSRPDM